MILILHLGLYQKPVFGFIAFYDRILNLKELCTEGRV
jgi:hypothetical protein